jgi:sialate O-acetylesterase
MARLLSANRPGHQEGVLLLWPPRRGGYPGSGGVINVAVSGSNIESWLNGGGYEMGNNYKRMLAPVVGYGIRGALWYQGESNEKDRRACAPRLKALIDVWRKDWSQPDSAAAGRPCGAFSFYFAQLAGISRLPADNPAGGDGRARIWQAQAEALALENTGMALILDIGDGKEHPPNKYDTGVRLAHLALHRDYGFGDLVPCGPPYKSHAVEGPKIRISFDHADCGLMLAEKNGFLPPEPKPGSKLAWLSIQAKDGTWHWADAVLDGADLVVSCQDVAGTIAVRYAYTTHPEGTLLYSKEGLPAAPFTTCGYDTEKVRAGKPRLVTNGSGGRDRTYDLVINSHPLCR